MGGGAQSPGVKAVTSRPAAPGDLVWRGKVMPTAIRDLGLLMYPVLESCRASGEEAVPALLMLLGDEQKAQVLPFLRAALDGRFKPAEIRDLLNTMAPGLAFSRGEAARRFLLMLADAIAEEDGR
jgi:hypothetical protein